MSQTLYTKMLDYIDASNTAVKVAQDLLNKQQEKKASEDLIGGVIAAMKSSGLLKSSQEDVAIRQLSSPDTAMQILHNVVLSYKRSSDTSKTDSHELGHPEKVASVQIEARRDEALLRLIGR